VYCEDPPGDVGINEWFYRTIMFIIIDIFTLP